MTLHYALCESAGSPLWGDHSPVPNWPVSVCRAGGPLGKVHRRFNFSGADGAIRSKVLWKARLFGEFTPCCGHRGCSERYVTNLKRYRAFPLTERGHRAIRKQETAEGLCRPAAVRGSWCGGTERVDGVLQEEGVLPSFPLGMGSAVGVWEAGNGCEDAAFRFVFGRCRALHCGPPFRELCSGQDHPRRAIRLSLWERAARVLKAGCRRLLQAERLVLFAAQAGRPVLSASADGGSPRVIASRRLEDVLRRRVTLVKTRPHRADGGGGVAAADAFPPSRRCGGRPVEDVKDGSLGRSRTRRRRTGRGMAGAGCRRRRAS